MMTPDLRQRVDALFEEALNLEASQWPAFLERACADAPAVRAEVESLLDHHQRAQAGDFLAHQAAAPLDVADMDTRPRPALQVPPVLAGYEILEELGRGGMGIVYKARQLRPKRLVALKMLRGGSQAGAEELARFRTETEAVARLQHPNLVQIFEVGEQEGRPFFVMEFVDGGTLAHHLSGTPLPARSAAELAQMLARAVHHAHQRGILHRDLKPANVLLTGDGQPKITDFGLAKRLQGEPGGTVPGGQTLSGEIMGTPSYMSPEQAVGDLRTVGPATDVYALGALLYEMLTGRPPFKGPSVLETLLQVRSREPVPPRHLQPKVPRDLETICLKCLRKQPGQRYATAQELADDLGRFLTGEPIQARPSGWGERGLKWARRRPAAAGLIGAFFLALMGLIAGGFWNDHQVRKTRTATLVENLLNTSRTTDLPRRLDELQPNRALAVPLLEEKLAAAPAGSQQQLNAQLALLPNHPELVETLYERLFGAELDDLPVLRDALAEHQQLLTPRLWTVLEDAGQSADRRFKAGLALALYAPDDQGPTRTRWQAQAPFLAQQVRGLNPNFYRPVLDSFRPIRDVLFGPLGQMFRDARLPEVDRLLVTILSADLLAADPPRLDVLVEMIEGAKSQQFDRLWKLIDRHGAALVPLLESQLNLPQEFEKAGGLLAGQFAFCQTLPLDQFAGLAQKLGKSGYRPIRFRPYAAGKAVQVAAIWTRDGWAWEMAYAKSAQEVSQLDWERRQQGLAPVDVAGYVAASDGGQPVEQFAALWGESRAEDGEVVLSVGLTEAEDRQTTADLGQKVIRRETHQVMRDRAGQLRFSAVWRQRGDLPLLVTEVSAAQFAKGKGRGYYDDISVHRPADPLYSGLWIYPLPGQEHWKRELVLGLDPAAQRQRCLDLAALAYRPQAISVAWPADDQPPVTASLWRLRLNGDEADNLDDTEDILEKQQANLAATLARLGKTASVWSLLRHSAEPGVRSRLIHQFNSLGVPAKVLIDRLGETGTEVSQRRALVLALGEYPPDSVPAEVRHDLEAKLRTDYRTDPDAGYHSAIRWLLRRWRPKTGNGTADPLRPLDEKLKAQDPVEGSGWYVNQQGQTLAVVPGKAAFWKGLPGFDPAEEPRDALHREEIPYSFAMATTEVTNKQFEQFYKAVGRRYQRSGYSKGDHDPALLLTWNQAVAYCQWLSQKEEIPESQWCYPAYQQLLDLDAKDPGSELPVDCRKTGYRLPTEAEWECACRAGTVTSRFYGSSLDLLTNYAWYRGTIAFPGNTEMHAGEVGFQKPNDWGLFDTYGNAWEWCQDIDGKSSERGGPPNRVLRGGAFDSRPGDLRSGWRYRAPQNQKINMAGIRLARTIAQRQAAKN